MNIISSYALILILLVGFLCSGCTSAGRFNTDKLMQGMKYYSKQVNASRKSQVVSFNTLSGNQKWESFCFYPSYTPLCPPFDTSDIPQHKKFAKPQYCFQDVGTDEMGVVIFTKNGYYPLKLKEAEFEIVGPVEQCYDSSDTIWFKFQPLMKRKLDNTPILLKIVKQK